MGLVTDVFWKCPCGSKEQAQVYGEWGDPHEFPVDAVPASRGLKWNPPCSKCGRYRLVIPEVFVKCVPVLVDSTGCESVSTQQSVSNDPNEGQ